MKPKRQELKGRKSNLLTTSQPSGVEEELGSLFNPFFCTQDMRYTNDELSFVKEDHYSIRPCKNLLRAIVKRAMWDIDGNDSFERRDACEWVFSEATGFWTFLWMLEQLDYSPEYFRAKCKKLLQWDYTKNEKAVAENESLLTSSKTEALMLDEQLSSAETPEMLQT